MDNRNRPVAALVDFLIKPFEAPPAVKIIPKVVEAFNLFLARVNMTKARDRLDLGKARVKIEDRNKGSEEVQLLVLERYMFTKNVKKSK